MLSYVTSLAVCNINHNKISYELHCIHIALNTIENTSVSIQFGLPMVDPENKKQQKGHFLFFQ